MFVKLPPCGPYGKDRDRPETSGERPRGLPPPVCRIQEINWGLTLTLQQSVKFHHTAPEPSGKVDPQIRMDETNFPCILRILTAIECTQLLSVSSEPISLSDEGRSLKVLWIERNPVW